MNKYFFCARFLFSDFGIRLAFTLTWLIIIEWKQRYQWLFLRKFDIAIVLLGDENIDNDDLKFDENSFCGVVC